MILTLTSVVSYYFYHSFPIHTPTFRSHFSFPSPVLMGWEVSLLIVEILDTVNLVLTKVVFHYFCILLPSPSIHRVLGMSYSVVLSFKLSLCTKFGWNFSIRSINYVLVYIHMHTHTHTHTHTHIYIYIYWPMVVVLQLAAGTDLEKDDWDAIETSIRKPSFPGPDWYAGHPKTHRPILQPRKHT